MDTNITLIALGYVAARLGMLITFAYIVYRVLRHKPSPVTIDDRSRYAVERSRATRLQR